MLEAQMRHLVSTIPVLALAVSTLFAQEEKPGAQYRIIVAVHHEGNTYTVAGKPGDRTDPVFDFLQRQGPAVFGERESFSESRIRNARPAFFHVWDDAFLGGGGYVHTRSRLKVTRLRNLGAGPEPPDDGRYDPPWNSLSLDPLSAIVFRQSKGGGFGLDTSATDGARSGFTVDAGGKIRVFMAWRGEMQTWTGMLPKIKGPFTLRHPQIVWDGWKAEEGVAPHPPPAFRVKTALKGTFCAYQDETHFFFVTESGEVHSLPRMDRPRETKLIWYDRRRPVCLLLEDTESGTTWAFAPRADSKADKGVADVYFPLAKEIVPVEYDLAETGKIDRAKPLATAAAHARYVAKHKKLGKPPARKDEK
jgi:hypothetical protein